MHFISVSIGPYTMIGGYNVMFGFVEILGKKWIAPVLIFLFVYGESTFSRIKRSSGITSRALSKKLKMLENLGLVKRRQSRNRKNVFYALSKRGKIVSEVLTALKGKLDISSLGLKRE